MMKKLFDWWIAGALSDINSLLNDGIPVTDFDLADDTSLSSRASSRFFDSEPILSLESFANSAVAGFLSSNPNIQSTNNAIE